jgi:flagellar biogenesis protein FliO
VPGPSGLWKTYQSKGVPEATFKGKMFFFIIFVLFAFLCFKKMSDGMLQQNQVVPQNVQSLI